MRQRADGEVHGILLSRQFWARELHRGSPVSLGAQELSTTKDCSTTSRWDSRLLPLRADRGAGAGRLHPADRGRLPLRQVISAPGAGPLLPAASPLALPSSVSLFCIVLFVSFLLACLFYLHLLGILISPHCSSLLTPSLPSPQQRMNHTPEMIRNK